MGEVALTWILGVYGAWMLANSGMIYWMKWDLKKIRIAVELFIRKNGEGAAFILHSPTDHFGLDELLDKYRAGHHDLSIQDWIKLSTICERIRNDKTIPQDELLAANNLMASMLAELVLHKTGGFVRAVNLAIETKKAA